MVDDILGEQQAVIKSLEQAIDDKQVTYDLARMIPGSTELKTSEFGTEMIGNM